MFKNISCSKMWEQENGLFIFCYLQTEQSYKRNPKALDQFQYCETNSIPIAIIIGGSEIEMGVVTLRIVGSREEVCDPKYLVHVELFYIAVLMHGIFHINSYVFIYNALPFKIFSPFCLNLKKSILSLVACVYTSQLYK